MRANLWVNYVLPLPTLTVCLSPGARFRPMPISPARWNKRKSTSRGAVSADLNRSRNMCYAAPQ